jgi:preprotein translocase subunit SecY
VATSPAMMANQKGLGELWTRLKFLLLAIIVYRVGSHIPVPGIDPAQLESIFNQTQNTIFGMANMFSGGALQRMSVLALGVMPYISASIIIQLLTAVIPQLEQLKKEGEQGRRKISQYTRYGTVVLATVQAFGMVSSLASQNALYSTGPKRLCISGNFFDIRLDVHDVAGRTDY